MEEGFAAASRKSGIPPKTFHIMYQQKAFHAYSWECSQMEYRLGELLGNNYESALQEFSRILDHTKRASSLVENLNSRICVYMNLSA